MMRLSLAAIVLALAATGSHAAGLQDSLARVRDLRRQAAELSDAAQPDLARAAALLEEAQRCLTDAESATDSQRLHTENYNNLIPLAAVYSRQGRKEQALAALEQARDIVWYPAAAQMLAAAPAFETLRAEPRFKAMLAVSALPGRLWQAPGAQQPYKDVLTVEERVAGLSLFWAEARQNFVYFDRVPELDWNAVYLEYLGKVMAAETTRDYYAVMLRLAPLLRDGHTNIWTPGELNREFYAVPPVRTVLAEGRVLVKSVDEAGVAASVGDEITMIDGLPVHDYARQKVTPLVSAGSPQDRDFQTYTVGLLRGSAADAVKLRLRAADGSERDATIARSADYQWPAEPVFRMLADGMAYIRIDKFTDDSGLAAFEAALPQILHARALVIDMRSNGGGNGEIGMKILTYLSRKPIPAASSMVRGESAYLRETAGAMVSWTPMRNDGYVAPREQVYEGPVALLTGPQTYSAGEDFAVSFRIMQRGQILGEATGGSTGQAINFKLPGGGGARVCAKRDAFPDGREFVGVGVAPDIEVKLTVAALRSGADPVLDRAVAELRKR